MTASAREVEVVARAMYESNAFKKPWDHPDSIRLWHPVYKRYARAAITALERERGK